MANDASLSEAKVVDLISVQQQDEKNDHADQDHDHGLKEDQDKDQGSNNGSREDKVGPQSPPPVPVMTTAILPLPQILPQSPSQPQPQQPQLPSQPQSQSQQMLSLSQEEQSITSQLPRFLSPRKVSLGFMEGSNARVPQTICSPCQEGVAAVAPTPTTELLKGSVTHGKRSLLVPLSLVDLSPMTNVKKNNGNNNNNNNNNAATVVTPVVIPDPHTIAKKYQLTHTEALATVRTFQSNQIQSNFYSKERGRNGSSGTILC